MKLDKILAVRKGKTVYRDGAAAIKVFDESYSKSDILNEALNQARIEETGLNIPKILEVGTVDGKWVLVLEYIEGKTLSELMAENPDKAGEYLELFVSLQEQIHGKKAPLLTTLKDKMTRKISYAELEATVRYDLQLKLREMSGASTVCHCDFSPSNVIIRNDGIPFIIDWSHATQGHACVDAVITYILFKLSKQDDTAEAYLSLFCEKSGVERASVLKWLPVAAASKSIKKEGEERKFLLSLANTVDYENGGTTL